jgi:peptidoglycan/xylan/chitin deacetylase (PgdA/CDA1 family)
MMLTRMAKRLARGLANVAGSRGRHRLLICAYHGLTSDPLPARDWCFLDVTAFRAHVEHLRRHFRLVPLSEAVRRLAEGALDAPTAVLTFDDGFRSVHDLAFPMLQALGVPATVFLVTGLLDTDDTVWFCRLHDALATTDRPRIAWDGAVLALTSPRERAKASELIQDQLKRLPPRELVAAVDGLVRDLGGDPHRAIATDSPYRMLDRTMVQTMARSGSIEFGAHTVSHAILRALAPAERSHEIARSLADVAAATERPCELFAYPNGRAEDYDAEAVRLLRACGVRAAVTTIDGSNDYTTPLLELRRFGVGAPTTVGDFDRWLP